MNYCKNCGEQLVEGIKFCSKCGTPRNDEKFNPNLNSVVPVYGSLIKIRYKCRKCKISWEITTMGGTGKKRMDVCPNCNRQLKPKIFG